MASENDEGWSTSVAVVDETVRATKKFLEEHSELIQLPAHGRSDQEVGAKTISQFLNANWNESHGYVSA